MSENNVAKFDSSPPSNATTPAEMLHTALTSGAQPETLAALMDLQERWEAGQARKAFEAAMAAFSQNVPTINKDKSGHNSKYASLSNMLETVKPVLAEYGLHVRFDTQSTPDSVSVTCVISHEQGHFAETTLAYGVDKGGPIKGYQALGSALTYLKRYALSAALGLGEDEIDDDGQAASVNSYAAAFLERIAGCTAGQYAALRDEVKSNKAKLGRDYNRVATAMSARKAELEKSK